MGGKSKLKYRIMSIELGHMILNLIEILRHRLQKINFIHYIYIEVKCLPNGILKIVFKIKIFIILNKIF